MLNELKSCPFCGGESFFGTMACNVCHVRCLGCGVEHVMCVEGTCYNNAKSNAIKAWNTRTQPPAVSELVECLKLFHGILNAMNNDFKNSGHQSPIPMEAVDLKYEQALANYKKEGE